MAFHRAVLVGTAVETQVRGDPGTREEDLHRGSGKSYIHLLLDVLIRHRIIHALHADVVVILDGSHLPDCQLKRRSRKRQQKQLLFLKTGRSAALPFLEGLVVKGIQLLSNGLIQFHEGQELAVAQSSQDPSGGHANGALHKGLVLRAAGTSQENGGAVVLGHLLVGLVEYCFRPGVLAYTGLEVVRREDAGDAAEIPVGVDMAGDPGLLLHVQEGLCVGVALYGSTATNRYASSRSPVSVSTSAAVWPAQSTCMVSPGLCSRCMV